MTKEKSSNHSTENLESSFSAVSLLNSEKAQEIKLSPIFSSLSSDDQSQALQLASTMDVSKYENVLQFGIEIQQGLKEFTHNVLKHVQRNDTSPIREILYKLMGELDKVNPDYLLETNEGFLRKIFRRPKYSIQEVITQYTRLSKHIDRLSIQLQYAQKSLLADMNMLNDLYRLNENYFNHINIYIAAGEMKLLDLKNNVYPSMQRESELSDNPMMKQKCNDLQQSIEWLDKRIYDLQLSREIAIQSAPQIRLIQQTNELLIEKIQSSVLTTIPLWQSQISILTNLNHQRRADLAQQRFMKVSDEMLRKNAQMIEATAKDSARQQITHEDIDTFKETQLQLIESIEETLRVQADNQTQQNVIETKIYPALTGTTTPTLTLK